VRPSCLVGVLYGNYRETNNRSTANQPTSSHIFDSELKIDGYDLFRQDRPIDRDGGGVLLYVRSTLHAVQVNLSAKFPEQVWCYVLDTKGHRCYIGVCYRSPTVNIYGSGNHVLLQDIVNELGATRKHFVMMGDCNYRYQSWPPDFDQPGISTEAVCNAYSSLFNG